MDGDAQYSIRHFAAHDEKRILQIDLVLGRHPLVGEFAIGKGRKRTRPVGLVGNFQAPIFELLAQRDEVGGFAGNTSIAGQDGRISRPMPAGTLELIERFADRLPGS